MKYIVPIARSLVALFMSGLVACSTVSEEAAFTDVASAVDKRINRKIQWPKTAGRQQAVDKAVKALLEKQMTAGSAVQIALLNNRSLRAAYADLGIARASLLQASLLPNPIVDAVFRFPVVGGPANIDFGIVFQFLDLVLMPLRRRVAESEFENAKLALTGEVIDLATRVRLAFYRFQAQQQLVGLFEQAETASAASVEAAQSLYRAGNITILEVATERSLHAFAKLGLANARAGLFTARERLNVLLGLSGQPASAWQVNQRLRRPPSKEFPLDGLEEIAVKKSLDLAAAKQKLTTLLRRFGVTRITSVLPELAVGASSERDEGAWDAGPSIALPIPIFDFGQAKRAQGRAQIAQGRDAYRALEIEVRSQAQRAAMQLSTAREMAQLYRKELLPLTRTILDQTLRQYNAMQFGVLQLIQAKQQQISLGQQYIETLQAYWLARAVVDSLLAGKLPSESGSAGNTTTGVSVGRNKGGH